MALSTSVLNSMLNWWFSNLQSSDSPPVYIYVALADDLGAEPSGAGYARVLTDNSDYGQSDGGVLVNVTPITFPDPLGDWGEITQVILYDAASGGNQLGAADMLDPIEMQSGSVPPEFIAGNMIFRIRSGVLEDNVLDAMLNWWFSNPLSGEAPPIYIWVGLTDSGDNEPSGGNYARVLTDNSDWSLASGGEVLNSSSIVFPAPTGNWGVMSKFKFFDAASGGNELGTGSLINSVNIIAGGTAPRIDVGNASVKLIAL